MKLKDALLAATFMVMLDLAPAVHAQSVPPPAAEQTIQFSTLLFIVWPWDAGYINRQDPFDVNTIEILFDSVGKPGSSGINPLEAIADGK